MALKHITINPKGPQSYHHILETKDGIDYTDLGYQFQEKHFRTTLSIKDLDLGFSDTILHQVGLLLHAGEVPQEEIKADLQEIIDNVNQP